VLNVKKENCIFATGKNHLPQSIVCVGNVLKIPVNE